MTDEEIKMVSMERMLEAVHKYLQELGLPPMPDDILKGRDTGKLSDEDLIKIGYELGLTTFRTSMLHKPLVIGIAMGLALGDDDDDEDEEPTIQ